MKGFLFSSPEQQRTPIRNLSGGERARLIWPGSCHGRPISWSYGRATKRSRHGGRWTSCRNSSQASTGRWCSSAMIAISRPHRDATIAADGEGGPLDRLCRRATQDMLAQRGGQDSRCRPRQWGGQASSQAGEARPAGRRARNLEEAVLQAEICARDAAGRRLEKLAAEIGTLEAKLADPDLYTKDPQGVLPASPASSTQRRAALAAREKEEWLELEIAARRDRRIARVVCA